MTLEALLKEYGLETDDVRWALAKDLSRRIAEWQSEGDDVLAEAIRSGALSDELYDMADRWAADRSEKLDRGVLDEGHLRDELASMAVLRDRRRA